MIEQPGESLDFHIVIPCFLCCLRIFLQTFTNILFMSISTSRRWLFNLTFLKCRKLQHFPVCHSSSASDKNGDGNSRNNNTEDNKGSVQKHRCEQRPLGSEKNKGKGDSLRPLYDPSVPPEESTDEMTPETPSSGRGSLSRKNAHEPDLTPPTNCCMSGCPNCVWINYVERLTKIYTDPSLGRDKVHADIESIEDGNIKAFLIMELKFRGLW